MLLWAAAYLGAPHLRLLVDSEPINLPSSSSSSYPALRRASADAAAGCRLPWRPSPSSAAWLRAHQPALLVLRIILPCAEPLLQLLRAAAYLNAPHLRLLVDSEPMNLPSLSSSLSCLSPSLC